MDAVVFAATTAGARARTDCTRTRQKLRLQQLFLSLSLSVCVCATIHILTGAQAGPGGTGSSALTLKTQGLLIQSRCSRFLQQQSHVRNPCQEGEDQRCGSWAGLFARLRHGLRLQHRGHEMELLSVGGSEVQRHPEVFCGARSREVGPFAKGRCWGWCSCAAPFVSAVGSCSGSVGLVFLEEGAHSEPLRWWGQVAGLDLCLGAAAWLLSALCEGFHPKIPCEQQLDKADKRYSETSASLNSAAPHGVPGMLPGNNRGIIIPSSPCPTR